MLRIDCGQQWVKQRASEVVTAVIQGRNRGGLGQGVAVEMVGMGPILAIS